MTLHPTGIEVQGSYDIECVPEKPTPQMLDAVLDSNNPQAAMLFLELTQSDPIPHDQKPTILLHNLRIALNNGPLTESETFTNRTRFNLSLGEEKESLRVNASFPLNSIVDYVELLSSSGTINTELIHRNPNTRIAITTISHSGVVGLKLDKKNATSSLVFDGEKLHQDGHQTQMFDDTNIPAQIDHPYAPHGKIVVTGVPDIGIGILEYLHSGDAPSSQVYESVHAINNHLTVTRNEKPYANSHLSLTNAPDELRADFSHVLAQPKHGPTKTDLQFALLNHTTCQINISNRTPNQDPSIPDTQYLMGPDVSQITETVDAAKRNKKIKTVSEHEASLEIGIDDNSAKFLANGTQTRLLINGLDILDPEKSVPYNPIFDWLLRNVAWERINNNWHLNFPNDKQTAVIVGIPPGITIQHEQTIPTPLPEYSPDYFQNFPGASKLIPSDFKRLADIINPYLQPLPEESIDERITLDEIRIRNSHIQQNNRSSTSLVMKRLNPSQPLET